jgi:hypothetical protein
MFEAGFSGSIQLLLRLAFPTAMALLTTPPQADARSDVPQFAVGAWRGVAYPASGDGAPGCSASTTFSNGNTVELLLTTDLRMGVGIFRPGGPPTWVPPGGGPVRAWVDDEPEFAFAGTVETSGIFLLVGSVREKAGASAFRRLGDGRALNVTVGGTLQRYALRGTYGTLAELVGCALKVRSGEVPFPTLRSPGSPAVAAAPVPAPAQAPSQVAQRPVVLQPPEPRLISPLRKLSVS